MYLSELCSAYYYAVKWHLWGPWALKIAQFVFGLYTPLLMDLHWLRVPERVKFKLCVLMHRCLLERRRDIWQSWQCLSPVLLVVVCARCHLLILSCLPLAVQPSVTVRSLLPVHERGTAYHPTFEHLHHHSTRLRNIWNPTSFNCLSRACRACDYVYIDYVRCSRSSSCRLLHPINCQTYVTLHYHMTWQDSVLGDDMLSCLITQYGMSFGG